MTEPMLTVTAPERHCPCRHRAIEGPIGVGVGETSFAERLAERRLVHTLRISHGLSNASTVPDRKASFVTAQ
jgi:hypothetical protein